MVCCGLCESYIHDTLDCTPDEFPNRRVEFLKLIRAGLPIMVQTIQCILDDIGIEFTQYFATMELDEIFKICAQYPLFLERLEGTLEELGRRYGIVSKITRNWLLNKYLIILTTIHQVHLEHTMLPKQHKQRKEIGKQIPVVSVIPGSGLTIRIPDENDLYS